MLFIKKFLIFLNEKKLYFTPKFYIVNFIFFTRNCSIEKIKIVSTLNVDKKILKRF